MYNLIIRPLLFCIDPEKVHRMLLSWLKFYRYLFPVRACVRGYSRVSDPFSYGHLQFKNRIGLSAGFDKNAEAFDELADFGFGFLEVGTVTPDSQSGNPSPRIFRLVDDESLISRTGFNNCGVDAVRQHIRKYRKHSYVLGVNINKNPLSTGDQIVKDFESTFIHLYDCVEDFEKMNRICSVDEKNEMLYVPVVSIRRLIDNKGNLKAKYAEMVLHHNY